MTPGLKDVDVIVCDRPGGGAEPNMLLKAASRELGGAWP